ncbi:hypothetical protein ACLOJK_024745 [Asimina triloba]
MASSTCKIIIWVLSWLTQMLDPAVNGYSWRPKQQCPEAKFEQKTDRFWEFDEKSGSWVELNLPFNLMSCVNKNCNKVGLIEQMKRCQGRGDCSENQKDGKECAGEIHGVTLPLRKRISLTKMSEASVWVTGQSGSIYERFWNGVQWVIAPHDLPNSAGRAVSVFIINQTILALSEAGLLYELQLTGISQPVWTECRPTFESGMHDDEMQPSSTMQIKSGVVTHNQEWISHGRPPGGDVAAIADAATIKPDLVFTVRYAAIIGGYLMERRFHQRKWKWIFHGAPEGHHLAAITTVEKTILQEKIMPLFFNTESGLVFEYQLQKQSGSRQGTQSPGTWVNHMHPPHTKAARGFPGLQLQVGRMLFTLDDGRLAELHLSGIGGEALGPANEISIHRKVSSRYEWSILDAPESEGWNAEYCTEERGPLNCMGGIKDTLGDDDQNDLRTTTRWRKGQSYQTYISPGESQSNGTEPSNKPSFTEKIIHANFRMRAVQAERSFFIITDGGLAFEYLYIENVWLWLRHDHGTSIKGVFGNYNGSLFVVDANGDLLIRERNGTELSWFNCTAMTKGRKVAVGPPWDGTPGKALRVTAEDALFFVGKNGRLLQFVVALRKFKWKDCQSPPNTRIAAIVDQEGFRKNVVFVIGRNGQLYQYNRITELWHEHYQSPHLVLARSPGTAIRQSLSSLTGSLFMLSEDGGLVEYTWSALEGWHWVEHGTPYKNVKVVGAPGPWFQGNQLFLIGSDGSVYIRYVEERTWQWQSLGYPYEENVMTRMETERGKGNKNEAYNEKTRAKGGSSQSKHNPGSHRDEKM